MTEYEQGRADALRDFRKAWQGLFYGYLLAQYGFAATLGFGFGWWGVFVLPVALTIFMLTVPADLAAQERFWRGGN